MFHFPASPPTALYIQAAATRHDSGWVSPFGHPRITARLTTPRGLSRPPTSFIGAWYQGIHRMPLLLGHHRYKMLAHTIHKSKNPPHTRLQPPHTGNGPAHSAARRTPGTRTTRTPGTTGPAPDPLPRRSSSGRHRREHPPQGPLPQTPNSACSPMHHSPGARPPRRRQEQPRHQHRAAAATGSTHESAGQTEKAGYRDSLERR